MRNVFQKNYKCQPVRYMLLGLFLLFYERRNRLQQVSRQYCKPFSRYNSDYSGRHKRKRQANCSWQAFEIQNIMVVALDCLTIVWNEKFYSIWIPGQCRVSENEEVDIAGKAGDNGGIPYLNKHFSNIKSYVNASVWSSWESMLTENVDKLVKRDVHPWKKSFIRNRREEVVLTWLRIGLNWLCHEHVMASEEQGTC